MSNTMTPGVKYWSIKASMESESYEDYEHPIPRRPWQGILQGDRHSLSRFDANDVLDDDTNATAHVSARDLFDTEAEAWVAYRTAATRQAEYHAAEADKWLTEAKA